MTLGRGDDQLAFVSHDLAAVDDHADTVDGRSVAHRAPPPAIEAETQAFFKKDWPRGHDRLAALSTRGVNRLVSGARHNIHRPNPELVTAAILEVVDQVRAKPRG